MYLKYQTATPDHTPNLLTGWVTIFNSQKCQISHRMAKYLLLNTLNKMNPVISLGERLAFKKIIKFICLGCFCQ